MKTVVNLLRNLGIRKFEILKWLYRISHPIAWIREKNKIYLIYTLGKVGSQTIYLTLRESLKELDVFHTHFVSKAWLESNHLPLSKKKKPVALAKYINKIIASPGKQVKIVSLVRDPVSKTISQLFQTPEAFGTTHDDLLKMDVNAICHLLTDLKREQFSYPCEWFDSEFFEFTGIDIYQEPFDHASHCQVESFKQFDVLVLRAEDLSDEALILQNIKKIVHKRVEAERLMVSNTTTQKKTGELYKKVKQSIKFTRDFLDQLYSSKYCRHFYTDEELDMFKRRWCQ